VALTTQTPQPRQIGALAAPVFAAGRTTRIISSMLFARGGTGWTMVLNRTRIDYRSELGDPSTNSAVGSVVGWIARNFPEAPVRIVREDDPEAPAIKRSRTGPGAMLRLLENPNPWFAGVTMWGATLVDYICRGNAYWIKVRNDADRVVELWWVPERLLQPRWPAGDPKVFIGWYELTLDGIQYEVEVRNVVHFRNGIDPHNTRKGRAPIDDLLREIFTDDEASNFSASLLKNLGVPGVVIAPANTTGRSLETNPEAVKTSFMEKFGGDKRGEPLVLTAPTDVKVLSFNPQQMELRELRRIPEERITARLGIPAGVAGLGAGLDRNTFTNYGEAKKAAYTEGVIPLHRAIASELEAQLLTDFVGDVEGFDVLFDVSVVAAMQEAQAEVDKRAQAAASKGLITRADYKRAINMTPAADGSDDVFLVPNNYLVIRAGSDPKIVISEPPARPALPPGGPAGLLTAGDEVRCPKGHLLAELASPPYRFTCDRCKAVVSSEAAA
jgi:HK97 family phage portal protein